MKTIAIESPFNGTPEVRQRNARYLAWCIHYVYSQGHAAYAGHGLGPTGWAETEEGRAHGIATDIQFRRVCDETWFFVDLGWTRGMILSRQTPDIPGRQVEVWLPTALFESFKRGEYPPGSTMRLLPVPEDEPPPTKESPGQRLERGLAALVREFGTLAVVAELNRNAAT